VGPRSWAGRAPPPAPRRYLAALRIYPDYAAAAINLAAAYDALGNYDESILLLGRFEGKSGALETARLRELGRALVGKAEYARAAAAYEKALAGDPADPLVHRNLGGLHLLHLGNSERGRTHLRRSLELAPHQPGAHEIRGALEGHRGAAPTIAPVR
jgi:tetratricopeptide (TPR) repeat protein